MESPFKRGTSLLIHPITLLFHSLLERQELWRRTEEDRIASLPDPSIPSGHALMPNVERLNTLELLETSEL